MKRRLVRNSLLVGLTAALGLPALAYSQRQAVPGIGPPPGPGAESAARQPRRVHGVRAGGPRGPQAGGIAARALRNANEIGLSDEQRDALLGRQREARESAINRRAETEIAGLELRDLMRAEPRDLDAIEAQMRRVAEYRVDARVASLRLEDEVRGILSAEQVDALEEMLDEARADRPRPPRRGRAPHR